MVEDGLPIPADKTGVPRLAFTADAEKPARCFTSLLLKPMVQPEVPGILPERYTEIRFFAPGNLMSNLDFAD